MSKTEQKLQSSGVDNLVGRDDSKMGGRGAQQMGGGCWVAASGRAGASVLGLVVDAISIQKVGSSRDLQQAEVWEEGRG